MPRSRAVRDALVQRRWGRQSADMEPRGCRAAQTDEKAFRTGHEAALWQSRESLSFYAIGEGTCAGPRTLKFTSIRFRAGPGNLLRSRYRKKFSCPRPSKPTHSPDDAPGDAVRTSAMPEREAAAASRSISGSAGLSPTPQSAPVRRSQACERCWTRKQRVRTWHVAFMSKSAASVGGS